MLAGQRYDERADTYSFGVILSEVRSRGSPFSDFQFGTNLNMKVVLAIKMGKSRPRIDESWEPEIQELVKRCTSMKMEERPGCAEVAEVLGALLKQAQDAEKVEEDMSSSSSNDNNNT